MEKQSHILPAHAATSATNPKRNRASSRVCVIAAAALLFWVVAHPWQIDTLRQSLHFSKIQDWITHGNAILSANKTLPADDEVDWAKVPLGELKEIQCWDPDFEDVPGTHCYRLQAPLDHLNHSDPRRASIAVAKYEAGGGKTPRSKVLGSVFFNPGGPGGSGVDWIRSLSNRTGTGLTSGGQYFDLLLESRYDILAHDPRGVKTTWPRADCWQDETLELVDETFHLGADLYHASSAYLPRDLAHNELQARTCQRNIGEELKYVNTPSTVRDLRMLYRAVGDKALHYIGISYGTVLGSYFAAMFPKEVGRFWIDAVVDVPDYQKGLWSDNLLDMEDVLSTFWTACAEAGPEHCALSDQLTTKADRETLDKGASIISNKFFAALESLRVQPVVVMDSTFPQVLTYLFVKAASFSAMYGPASWPTLAKELAPGIKDGNWTAFVAANGLSARVVGLNETLPRRRPKSKFSSGLAQSAIMGSDALLNKQILDAGDYEERLKRMEKISPFGAEIWTRNSMTAATWPIDGSEKYAGAFNTTPAFPILFGSNDFDPVTPLVFARKMAASFDGSALFRVSGGVGHSSISLPSKCAAKTIADYFVRGALPKDLDARGEKVCYLDRPPFIPRNDTHVRDAIFSAAVRGERDEWAQILDEEAYKDLLVEEAHVGIGQHHAQWKAAQGKYGRPSL